MSIITPQVIEAAFQARIDQFADEITNRKGVSVIIASKNGEELMHRVTPTEWEDFTRTRLEGLGYACITLTGAEYFARPSTGLRTTGEDVIAT